MLKARPELEPVIGRDDARLRATNDVIGLLRNYIHGEALTQQLSDDRQPGITDYMMGTVVIGAAMPSACERPRRTFPASRPL